MRKGFGRSFIRVFVFLQLFIFSKPMFSVGFGGALDYAFQGSLAKGEEGKNSVAINSLAVRSTFAWRYFDLSLGLKLDIGKSRITSFYDIAKGDLAPNHSMSPLAQIKGRFETWNDVYTMQYFTFEALGKIPTIVGMNTDVELCPLFGVAIDVPLFGVSVPDFLIPLQENIYNKSILDNLEDNLSTYYLLLLQNHLAIWGELGLGLDIYVNEKIALKPQLLCGISHAIIPNKRDLGISYKIDLRLGFSYYKR